MKAIKGLFIVNIVVGMSSIVSAHQPPGEMFPTFQFPAQALPTIDGDLSDWDMVPEKYWITLTSHFAETRRGIGTDFDLADVDIKAVIGWSPANNRVYMMAEVIDDVLHNKRSDPAWFNWDDEWNFVIDADHSDGDFVDMSLDWNTMLDTRTEDTVFTSGQNYSIQVPPIDGYWNWLYIGGWWLTQNGRGTCCPDLLEAGWTREGESDGPGRYSFELKVTPWEFLSFVNGLAGSRDITLEEGQIIHAGFMYKDYDHDSAVYDGSYDFPPFHDIWHGADLLADFSLTPIDPDVQWGFELPVLTMPDLTGREGDIVTVPVRLDGASLVAGGDLTITYDPEILTFREARNGELISSGGYVAVANIVAPGRLLVSVAGSQALTTESGTFVDLEFQAREYRANAANTSELRFSRGSLTNETGELISARCVNGSFALSVGEPGDVNQDGSVTSADAILALRFAVALIALDEVQQALADVNGDGRINAGDAVLILRKAVGLIPKPVAAVWSTPKLAWGTPASGTEGAVTIPLLFEGDIHGGDFLVRYEGATWQPTGLRAAGQNAVWAMRSEAPGTFRFTVASTATLERLELVLEGASGTPSLSLAEALVVDGGGRPVAAEMPSVAAQVSALPGRFALLQNYPNPFNPQTHITYHLARSEAVRLQVFALTGQSIRTLGQGVVSGGAHTVVWDGRDTAGEPVSSGVYLVRLEAGDFTDTKRMMLLR